MRNRRVSLWLVAATMAASSALAQGQARDRRPVA